MADEYAEVKIDNITILNKNFIILLRRRYDDTGETDEVLPICIGSPEAHSIAAAYRNHPFPRPLTHDLLKDILGTLGGSIEKIQVNDLKNGTFYAQIFLNFQDETLVIDSRPSDAIAMALRYDAPMYVREDIISDNAVPMHHGESQDDTVAEERPKAEPEDPVERLRHLLEQAVKAERYEDAAQLRDRLQELENDNN